MSEIDFPTNPADGTIYTFQNKSWQWNASGPYWFAVSTTIGYSGSQGFTGSTGAYAAVGFTGSQGTGFTGSAGLNGNQGYAGSQGPVGYWGSFGYTGSRGANYRGTWDTNVFYYVGDVTTFGDQMYFATANRQSSPPDTGSWVLYSGPTGYTGSQGITGYVGSQGVIGYDGSLGYTGSTGACYVGSQGILGYTGSLGFTGSMGESSYIASDTAPSNPAVGDRWYVSNQGIELVWTNDGSSYQWVELAASGFAGAVGYTGSTGYVGSKATSLTSSSQSDSYTLQASDDGKIINTSSFVTVPSGVFSPGQTITIYNNSQTTALTVVEGSGITMYLVNSTQTGNRSVGVNGIAVVICVDTNKFVISGGGVS